MMTNTSNREMSGKGDHVGEDSTMVQKETEEGRKPVEETRLTSMEEKHGQNKPRTETFGVI